MTMREQISFDALPADLPIFPLPRVIVLPRVNLPLNIFEPRYLAMVDHALKTDRMIGMIQLRDGEVYKTGCAGRITSFQETHDGRYLITLQGVCRFGIAEELPLHNGGFRHIRPDWTPYKKDLIPDISGDICRKTISGLLRRYFDKMQIACDQWKQINDMPCETLISTLSVICPFTTDEKQALLEADTLAVRIRILQSFIENVISREDEKVVTVCH